jgi:hypothetical protein
VKKTQTPKNNMQNELGYKIQKSQELLAIMHCRYVTMTTSSKACEQGRKRFKDNYLCMRFIDLFSITKKMDTK